MRSTLFGGLSLQIITDKAKENSIMDNCFIDPDQNSEVYDDFFTNLESSYYDADIFQVFKHKPLRYCGPKRTHAAVLKHGDILRTFPVELEKAMNSYNESSLMGFFSTFCVENCEIILPDAQEYIDGNSSKDSQQFTHHTTHFSATLHLLAQLQELSDGLFLLHDTKFPTLDQLKSGAPSCISCRYSFKGTQLTPSVPTKTDSVEMGGDNLFSDLTAYHGIYSAATGMPYGDADDLQWCQQLDGFKSNIREFPGSQTLPLSPCGSPTTPRLLPPPGFNKFDRRNKLMVSTLGDNVGYLRDTVGRDGRSGSVGSLSSLSSSSGSTCGGSPRGTIGTARRHKAAKSSHAKWEGGASLTTSSSLSTASDDCFTLRGYANPLSLYDRRSSAIESGFWLLSSPRLVNVRGVLKMHINSDKRIVKVEMRPCPCV